MSELERQKFRPTNYMGCYGGFRPEDRICRNHCSINLRCAIETDQRLRIDILEELFEEEDMLMSTH